MNEILDAILFATEAHAGQTRKWSGLPYVTHPIKVAQLVAQVSTDKDLVIAAVLHDTIEDTDVTFSNIAAMFGPWVALLVDELTDTTSKETHPTLSRAQRRKIDHERLQGISDDAKTIKLSDIIHNVSNIDQIGNPEFRDLYLMEKLDLIPRLKGGDAKLYKMAEDVVHAKMLLVETLKL